MPQDAPANYVVLRFGDGDYTFRLGLAQIAELQRTCGAGIGAIYARVLRGRYTTQGGVDIGSIHEADFYQADLRETIRLGLIGGKSGTVNDQPVDVSPDRARQLVENYVDTRPLYESWTLAAAILTALVVGYAPEGAKPADKKKARATRKADSTTHAH